jgi:hypothetical protein
MSRVNSLAIWAVLTLVPSGLQARCEGPVVPHAPFNRPSVLVARLVALASRRGHAGNDVPDPYAHTLGLTAAGRPWINYSVGLRFAGGKIHSFQMDRGNGSDVLFTARNPNGLTAFRVHRNQVLTCAIRLDIVHHRLTMRRLGEAQADFAAEIALWAARIDGIDAGTVKIAN